MSTHTTHEYDDPRRRVLILTYADGTVVTDDPYKLDVSQPLRDYLVGYHYSPNDTEVPTHIYVGCGFCGDLHEVRMVDRQQRIDNSDYIHVSYTLEFEVKDPSHGTSSWTPFLVIGYRIDGRS